MTRRSSYSEGLAFNVVNFGVGSALGVGASIVTARIYGATVLGQFALAMAAANLVMLLSSARERPAFVRQVATLDARDRWLSALWVAVFGFSVTLTLTVALLLVVVTKLLLEGPIDAPEVFAPAVVMIGIYALLENSIAQVETVFTVFRSGRALFRVRLAQAFGVAVISIGLGLMWPTVWSLVVATGVAAGVTLAWRVVLLRSYVTLRLSQAELRRALSALPEVIRFGLKIAPGGFADGASNQAGTWILGSYSSLAIVGAYNRGWQLARSVLLFNNRVTEMLFPTLVERHERHDHAGFDRALVDTLRYSGAGMLLLAAVVGGAAHGVMDLYGPGFDAAAEVLPWLLSVPALLAFAMIQRHALYVFDRPLQATASALLRMVVTIGATFPLTAWLGIAGPGIALCAGLVVDIAFTTARVVPRLSTPLRTLWQPRQAVGLVAACGLGFACARVVDLELGGVAGTLCALAAGSAAYAAALIGVGGLTAMDRQRLERAWALRPGHRAAAT